MVLPNLNISLLMFLLPATAQNCFLKYPLDPKPHLSEDCNVPNHLNLLHLIPRVLINSSLSSFCSISKYLFTCSSCFFLHILFVLPNYNMPIPRSIASLINLRSQIILHYSTNSTSFQESLCTVWCTTHQDSLIKWKILKGKWSNGEQLETIFKRKWDWRD